MNEEDEDGFTMRELRLINNCLTYANNDPAGLPGHNLEIIIAKQHNLIKKLKRMVDVLDNENVQSLKVNNE